MFYDWISHDEPVRDPCPCGSPRCDGYINFDLGDEDAAHIRCRRPGGGGQRPQAKPAEYTAFLQSIRTGARGESVADTRVRIKLWASRSRVCSFGRRSGGE
jgi:hypothetical protein